MQQHAERDADDGEHEARHQRLTAGQQEARRYIFFNDDALEATRDLRGVRHDETVDQPGLDQQLDHHDDRGQAGEPEHDRDGFAQDESARHHLRLAPPRRDSSSLRPLLASSRRSFQICAT